MNLIDLLILYEKITNKNKRHDADLLKNKDGCATEAKLYYKYRMMQLIIELIDHEEDASLLENLILKYETKITLDPRIILPLYRKCLSLNKNNTMLFKKFSEYLL